MVSEGGRGPSTLSTGHGDAGAGSPRLGPLAPGQRWSAARKREVVLRLLRGESAELLSRELGLPIYSKRCFVALPSRSRRDAQMEEAWPQHQGMSSSMRDCGQPLTRRVSNSAR